MHNIAAVIDHVVWVIESGIAKPNQIGIATPYGGQVNAAYSNALSKVATDKPKLGLEDLQIVPTDYWTLQLGQLNGGKESKPVA